MSAQQLSKAQKELLLIIEHGPKYVASYYPPANKLVAYGFAEWVGNGDHLALTDAGRAAIKEQCQDV